MDFQLNEFFSSKHKPLLNIAFAANIFAWIIFLLSILAAIGKAIPILTSYYQSTQLPFNSSPIPPIAYANDIFTAIRYLLTGVFYGLLLKGISLGLNMIVETDINYREKLQEVDHGQ